MSKIFSFLFFLISICAIAETELIWEGSAIIGSDRFPALLHKVKSRLGEKPTEIDHCFTLSVRSKDPDGSILMMIGGGRGVQSLRSFGGEFSINPLNVIDFLKSGYTVAYLEYRGSRTPGSREAFDPPLPNYGEIIPKFDTDEACEYGLGDAFDVVAGAEFLISGEAFEIDKDRVFVVGGSHGGYLALRIARDVEGIAGVAAGHGPVDLRGQIDFIENAPKIGPPMFRPQSPHFAFNYDVGDGMTAKKAFLKLNADLNDRPRSDASISLLNEPPKSTNILILHNVDDWLVPVLNSRRYFTKWGRIFPTIRYFEFSSDQVPIYFPKSARDQKKNMLLSTHGEEIRGSVIEHAINITLGLENDEIDLPDSRIVTTDFTLKIRSPLKSVSVGNLEVILRDYDGWITFDQISAKSDPEGKAEFENVPIGYHQIDVIDSDGVRHEDLSIYVPRKPIRPIEIRLPISD